MLVCINSYKNNDRSVKKLKIVLVKFKYEVQVSLLSSLRRNESLHCVII
jgi:hypothetical protein